MTPTNKKRRDPRNTLICKHVDPKYTFEVTRLTKVRGRTGQQLRECILCYSFLDENDE